MNAPLPRRDVETAPRRLRFFSVESLLFFVVPAALLAAFFFRPLIEGERFSYRDVGYFYYPLFEQIQNEWERGRLPLWDPFENLGQPLAGNPTSSVFYPGKAIFFLASAGCVDFNACFSFYIIGHVALSFFGVYFLTRRLGISRGGSTLAGLSFAFSGPILFQYSNVVFLVGAAWLPFLALFSFDFFAATTIDGKLKSTLKLSVAQALAILGGEPQIVYLSTIAFFAFAFFAPVRLVVKTASPPVVRLRDRFRTRAALALVLLVAASVATFFLAAPQILPSAELIARSSRAAQGPPRSLWEIPSALWRNSAKNNGERPQASSPPRLNKQIAQNSKIAQDAKHPQTDESAQKPTFALINRFAQNKQTAQSGESAQNKQTAQSGESSFYSALLGGEIEKNGRNRAIYRFSVGPWRWAERLFPNVGGRQFPRSSRWFAIFPEEIAVWTPTLYCGVVPYLLALSAARFRFARRRQNRQKAQIHRPRKFSQLRYFPQLCQHLQPTNSDKLNATDKLPSFSHPNRSPAAAFRVWATWLVLVSTTAALGGFGVVWAIRFVDALLAGSPPARTFVDGDPLGGVYWLFNLILPKFVEFRYPAKLLTLSALGLAVLTGFGWDERRFSRRFSTISSVVLAISCAAFVVVSSLGDALFSAIRTVDPLYGPFQPRLAFESVRGAFTQTAVVLGSTLLLLALERRFYQSKNKTSALRWKFPSNISFRRRRFPSPTSQNAPFEQPTQNAQTSTIKKASPILTVATGVALAVSAISAIDLYVANGWTIATAPPEIFERRSPISRLVEAERAARCSTPLSPYSYSTETSQFNVVSSRPVDSTQSTQSTQFNPTDAQVAELDAPPIRIYRFPVWFSNAFQTSSSAARTTERVVWDAATLFPKLPFSRGIATTDARGTATEAEYAAFVDAFPLGRNRDADAAFLDVAFFLGPPELTARLAAPTAPTPRNRQTAQTTQNEYSTANVSLRRVVSPTSRVSIFRDGRPAALPDERAEIVAYEPNRIVYLVELSRPADLVFAEQYWPDWQGRAYPLDADAVAALSSARFDADAASRILRARVDETFDAPIESTLRFLRKTTLPAGTYCFVATYRPRRLLVGAILGALAWGGLLVVAATRRLRPRRRDDGSQSPARC